MRICSTVQHRPARRGSGRLQAGSSPDGGHRGILPRPDRGRVRSQADGVASGLSRMLRRVSATVSHRRQPEPAASQPNSFPSLLELEQVFPEGLAGSSAVGSEVFKKSHSFHLNPISPPSLFPEDKCIDHHESLRFLFLIDQDANPLLVIYVANIFS